MQWVLSALRSRQRWGMLCKARGSKKYSVCVCVCGCIDGHCCTCRHAHGIAVLWGGAQYFFLEDASRGMW